MQKKKVVTIEPTAIQSPCLGSLFSKNIKIMNDNSGKKRIKSDKVTIVLSIIA